VIKKVIGLFAIMMTANTEKLMEQYSTQKRKESGITLRTSSEPMKKPRIIETLSLVPNENKNVNDY